MRNIIFILLLSFSVANFLNLQYCSTLKMLVIIEIPPFRSRCCFGPMSFQSHFHTFKWKRQKREFKGGEKADVKFQMRAKFQINFCFINLVINYESMGLKCHGSGREWVLTEEPTQLSYYSVCPSVLWLDSRDFWNFFNEMLNKSLWALLKT